MPRSIDNLEDAFTEMYEFITDLPSGLDDFESDFDEAFKELENLKVAITQLGKPLTLEQLREMDGKPVWVVCLKKEKYIDPPIGWRILEKSISGSFGVWNGENCLSQRSYSSDWFAYSYPPAHIDRGEWTAEWIYPENEWNLPRCSKCGCNSKDATYGHKDRFCPKCGRAMTEEAWAELEQRLQRAPLPEPPEER